MSTKFMNHFKGKIEKTDKEGVPGILKHNLDPIKLPNSMIKPMQNPPMMSTNHVNSGQIPVQPNYMHQQPMYTYGQPMMPYMQYTGYQPYFQVPQYTMMSHQYMQPQMNPPALQYQYTSPPEPFQPNVGSDNKRKQKFRQAADNILVKPKIVNSEVKVNKNSRKENVKARAKSNGLANKTRAGEELKQLQHVNYEFGGLGPNYTEEWKQK